jgi:polyhydroxyalkanoate synthesis regulator phasin
MRQSPGNVPETNPQAAMATNPQSACVCLLALQTILLNLDCSSPQFSSSSARPTGIKEEHDLDQLDPTPPPPPSSRLKHVQPPHAHSLQRHDSNSSSVSGSGATASAPAPPPSLSRPPPPSLKRRRVTISGVAQPLITNLRSSDASLHTPTQVAGGFASSIGPSTPISPVVMGFTIQPDDPQAFEQVRSMLTVKQKQKALIEQRRGSIAGLADGRRGSAAGLIEGRRGSIPNLPAVVPVPQVSIVNPTPTSATAPTLASSPAIPKRNGPSPNGSSRLGQPSPPAMSAPSNTNASPGSRSAVIACNSGGSASNPRALSPSGHMLPSQSQGRLSSVRSPPASQNVPSTSHSAAHTQGHPQSQVQATSMSAPSLSQSSSQGQSQNQPPTPSQSSAQLATQGLTALANALPPPPNSFARRRAGQLGVRGKPADIVISPRDSDAANPNQGSSKGSVPNPPPFNYKTLQPAIQSAPPRPGQQPGRFPMALPSLPPAIGQRGTAVRRAIPGQVPPTPTGLSLQRQQGTKETSSVRLSQPARSPGLVAGTATVPISSTVNAHLPPRTPATLNQPANNSADKVAFLQPFEQFYDALSDARVLKGWFGEQLARVGRVAREVEEQKAEVKALKSDLEKQQKERESRAGAPIGVNGTSESQMERLIAEAIGKEMRAWRDEVTQLRGRIAELEEELSIRGRDTRPRDIRDSPRDMPEMNRVKFSTSKSGGVNGNSYPMAPGVESYTFPPVQPPVSMSLPPPPSASVESVRSPTPPRQNRNMVHGRLQQQARRSPTRSEASASPAPFESGPGRRLSTSAMRYDPPTQQRRQQELLAAGSPPRRSESGKSSPEHRKDGERSEPVSRDDNATSGEKSALDTDKPNLKRHNSHTGVVKTGHPDRPSHSPQLSTDRARISPKGLPKQTASPAPMEEDD